MAEKVMHVGYAPDTGEILGIAARQRPDVNSVAVPLAEVKGILEGLELISNYQVQYSTESKQMEFASKHNTEVTGTTINDFIYELPEDNEQDSDIQIIQDIPNTCWKIVIGKRLRENLMKKGINLNHKMVLSVTEKGDPNILYKTLFADLSSIVTDNYVILPFSMPFEYTNQPFSVYTARRFDTYQIKRIFNEQ